MGNHSQDGFTSWDEKNREVISKVIQQVLETHHQHRVGSLAEQADLLQKAALLFFNDNIDKTPEELAAMARAINFGGAHDAGLTVRYVREYVFAPCPRLVAACLYEAWQGGKGGFQFLPDPAETDPEEYDDLVSGLIETLEDGAPDPRQVLLNGYSNDLDFYNSLPGSFTVYRGTGGIPAERAAAGVCWTTSRAMADWFAGRLSGAPVVISARVRKSEVRLAFSGEHEIVVAPRKFRVLKFRGQPAKRPSGWGPERTKPELEALYKRYGADDAKLRERL